MNYFIKKLPVLFIFLHTGLSLAHEMPIQVSWYKGLTFTHSQAQIVCQNAEARLISPNELLTVLTQTHLAQTLDRAQQYYFWVDDPLQETLGIGPIHLHEPTALAFAQEDVDSNINSLVYIGVCIKDPEPLDSNPFGFDQFQLTDLNSVSIEQASWENSNFLDELNETCGPLNLNSSEPLSGKRKHDKCSECNREFADPRNFKRHLRTHTGETPYKCSECNREFVNSGNLKSHLRTHTKETPHKCSECNKEFTQSCNLKTHMRTHTGEKPYKCSECNKGFPRSDSLKAHMRTHTGEKPHKCSECYQEFVELRALKKHLQRVHSN